MPNITGATVFGALSLEHAVCKHAFCDIDWSQHLLLSVRVPMSIEQRTTHYNSMAQLFQLTLQLQLPRHHMTRRALACR